MFLFTTTKRVQDICRTSLCDLFLYIQAVIRVFAKRMAVWLAKCIPCDIYLRAFAIGACVCRFVKDAVRLTRHDTVTVEVSGGAVDKGVSRGTGSQEGSGGEASLMDNIVSASQAGDSQSSTASNLLDSVEGELHRGVCECVRRRVSTRNC